MIWQIDDENERGQVTKEEFKNGLLTQRKFDIRSFLRKIDTTGNTQQHAFDYYPTGSLQSRSNQVPLSNTTISEQFQYDPLDRLHEWTVTSQTSATNPQANAFDPTTILDQVFDYDDIGNLRERTTVAGPWPSLSYQYGQNGAGPHAVSQVNLSTYRYDLGGNQTLGPKRAIRYKAFNLPKTITEGGNKFLFKYDVSSQRAAKHYPNGNTITYVGGLYERRVGHGLPTDVYYVPGAEFLVAQVERTRATGNDTELFLHDDHLGSIVTVTNRAGGIFGQAWYEPFGQAVDPSNPALLLPSGIKGVTEGFTQQSTDADLGLVNMKGRIYDPKIGRFLTPDPFVQTPLLRESLSRYSYALNNPLKWTDPSGFQDEGPGAQEFQCGGNCVANFEEGEEIHVDQSPPDQPSVPSVSTLSDNGPSQVDPMGPTQAPSGGSKTTAVTCDQSTVSCTETITVVGRRDKALSLSWFEQTSFLKAGILPPLPLSKRYIDLSRTTVSLNSLQARMPDPPAVQLFGTPGARYLPTVLSLIPRAYPILLPELAAETEASFLLRSSLGAGAVEGLEDMITLYHGSVDGYSEIMANGLDPARTPTWVTTDLESAQNAIGPDRVLSPGQGADTGIITSQVSRSQFQALQQAGEISGLRNWPGFGGGANLGLSEYVLRGPNAVQLFNSGIVP
jgi:RHS repeat-associated protein